MSEPVVLQDYMPIPDQHIDFCQHIQSQINRSECQIITLFDEEATGHKPEVFAYFNSQYRAQQYVGVITGHCADTKQHKSIVIGSRFDEGREQHFLNYVFSKAFDMSGKIFENMTVHSSPEQVWDQLLMLVFINQLEAALKQGTFRQYKTFHYNDSKIKGKIDVSAHIRLNPLQTGNVAYSSREYTTDHPLNVLIMLAYDCLCRKYPQLFPGMVKRRSDLQRKIEALRALLPDYKKYSYRDVIKETSRPVHHPYYVKYEALRKTAIMILRRMGLNIFTENRNEVFGVLIDMNKLWEKFLYQVIFRKLDDSDSGEYVQQKIPILMDHQDHRAALVDQDRGPARRHVQPDFYFENKAVFDAKYRAAWGENIESDSSWNGGVRNDVFQVLAYMLALDVNIGGVVFPVKTKHNIGKYKISELCSRLLYTIAYHVPQVDSERFYQLMEEQNDFVRKEIRGVLGG